MTAQANNDQQSWLITRLKRHLFELMRLSVPVVMLRVGILSLGIVDTAMVGHYATKHLAWLNLAHQSIFMFVLLIGIGLITGTTVYASSAFGTDDHREAGKVWRRTLPFVGTISIGIVLLTWPAEYWLLLLGQSTENAYQSGRILQILAIGLPAQLFFTHSTMFMEGVKRANIGFYIILVGNVLNVGLNYLLIFGNGGMPELGAEGSAWASTILRWAIATIAVTYVLFSPSMAKFEVRKPHGQHWHHWRAQRVMGYASSVSLGMEVLAFSALAVFAGWLGTLPVAAHGVMSQVIGLPLMIAIGIGVASTIRVGIAHSRSDKADVLLAGLVGLLLGFLVVGVFATFIYMNSESLISIFTADTRIVVILLPIAGIYCLSMMFDSVQMVASLVLRGLKETWWPTYLQGFSFGIVMLPVSYLLAFPVGLGLEGLAYGMLLGVSLSCVLQILRFVYLVKIQDTA